LNSFTGSVIGQTNTISTFTASVNFTTQSLNTQTGSQGLVNYQNSIITSSYRIELNSIEAYTASLKSAIVVSGTNVRIIGELSASRIYTEYITSSVLFVTGSNIIGDQSSDKHEFTGSVNIKDTLFVNGQAIGLSELNSFTGSTNTHILKQATQTGSQDLVNYNISVVTSSIDKHILNIATQTGSQQNLNAQIGIATASLNTYTGSNDSVVARILQTTASINLTTGSLIGITNGIMALTASMKAASIVSSSTQVQNYDVFALNSNLYNGTGSLQAQLNGIMAVTASMKAASIVSSSQQITNYYKFAETASANIFYGNQRVNGELKASILRTDSHAIVSDGSATAVVLQGYINNALRIAESGSASSGGSRGMLYVGAIDVGGTTAFAENLVMASGKGIDFSATSNVAGMTSELLNDYEEGSWTPVISDGTNNATMTATYNNGKYIKVGRNVTLTGYILTDSLGSVTGTIRITGIPFTNGSGYGYIAGGVIGNGGGLNITAGHNITTTISTGGTYLLLNVWDDAAGATPMQASEWSADGQIQMTITYITDY